MPRSGILRLVPRARTMAGNYLRVRPTRLPSMPFEAHQCTHGHVHRAQFCSTAEIRQVDDETGGYYIGTDLAQQFDRALGGTAGGDEVVDQNHALTGMNGVRMHLHLVDA